MTLKELAYVAQSRLQSRLTFPVKRGHVLELLAAAAGFRSWAAFDSAALLADAETKGQGLQARALIAGRAIQLEYSTADAEIAATVLTELISDLKLSFVEWQALATALHAPSAPSREHPDDEDELTDEELEDDDWDTEPQSRSGNHQPGQVLPASSPPPRQPRTCNSASSDGPDCPLCACRLLPLRAAEPLPVRGVAERPTAIAGRARLG